jgi:peptidoglycan/LPS O-acetylase OafA/YrhL
MLSSPFIRMIIPDMQKIEPMDQTLKRNFGLDLLRFFAIVFVIYEHGVPIVSHYLNKWWVEFFIFDGVSFFFVLSGFLIGGILLRTLNQLEFSGEDTWGSFIHTLGKFWRNRWFRTLPAYLVVLSFLFVIERQPISEVWRYFLFLQNLTTPHPSFFPEAWSLAVEEWFYLSSPLLIFALVKLKVKPDKSIWMVAFLVVLFSMISRWMGPHASNFHDWGEWVKKPVIYRLDSMMYGFIGALLYARYQAGILPQWERWKSPLFITGLGFILFQKMMMMSMDSFFADSTSPSVFLELYFQVFSLSVVSLGTLMLLPHLITFKPKTSSLVQYIMKWITHVSLISYSLYLVNLTLVRGHIISRIQIRFGVNPEGLLGDMLELGWFLGFTYLGALLLFKFVERPWMNWRNRINSK